MNLGLENTLLEAAAHLCELAALKRNHIWSKYSAVTCAIYSVGYALPEVLCFGGRLFLLFLVSSVPFLHLILFTMLRKEMDKYRDVDEDELLQKLSEEELRRLEDELEELDPDNALLPAGFRQRDQTKKAPTGSFQRDNLLTHLEKQAKEHPDQDDLVPYTGEKRGKAWVPKSKVVDPILEDVTLEPELEEALSSATDAELCDIAGELACSMHMSILETAYVSLNSFSFITMMTHPCALKTHGYQKRVK